MGTAESPGAGRIGPLTKKNLTTDWKKSMVAQRAEKLLLMKKIGDTLEQRGKLVNTFLASGQNGKTVRAVQEFLADQGFFPQDKINGHFGPLTGQSVTAYQLARGIIKSEKDTGAGTVGPATLTALRSEQVRIMYKLVRAEGLRVL